MKIKGTAVTRGDLMVFAQFWGVMGLVTVALLGWQRAIVGEADLAKAQEHVSKLETKITAMERVRREMLVKP